MVLHSLEPMQEQKQRMHTNPISLDSMPEHQQRMPNSSFFGFEAGRGAENADFNFFGKRTVTIPAVSVII